MKGWVKNIYTVNNFRLSGEVHGVLHHAGLAIVGGLVLALHRMSLLPHRVASSSLISLTKPITPNTLRTLRDILKRPDQATPPPTTLHSAAVLIPFCNVGGEPGILLEVRSKSLRTHSGEIRWEPLRTLNI